MRYLGYRGGEVTKGILDIIKSAADEAKRAAMPGYCVSEFEIEKNDGIIRIKNSNIVLPGESIQKHLKGCGRILIFAATIGAPIEKVIGIYEVKDMTKAVILDCCASALIEEYCNSVCAELEKKYNEKGLFLTSRFSPGYGDLPMALQSELLNASNAARIIGLSCNEKYLMTPRKSVTAIIGISEKEVCKKEGCSGCSMEKTCPNRRK